MGYPQDLNNTHWQFPETKRLHTFAASHDVHIDFTWQLRTHEWLQHADELSRILDSSEILLRHKQFAFVCKLKHKGRVWGWPYVFAGAAKGQHQADLERLAIE